MYKRTNQQKLEFLQANECHNFAALPKEVPMGRKDTALPDPPLKNHSLKCLTYQENNQKPYKDNLCLLRALALHLHGNERLESKTSKKINLFLKKTGGTNPANLPRDCMEDFARVEDIVQAEFSCTMLTL